MVYPTYHLYAYTAFTDQLKQFSLPHFSQFRILWLQPAHVHRSAGLDAAVALLLNSTDLLRSEALRVEFNKALVVLTNSKVPGHTRMPED